MALASSDKETALTEHETPAGVLRNKRRQRLRSYAIAWALFALAVMFFLVTIVRLGANVANRPL
jgi:hypothetical protein